MAALDDRGRFLIVFVISAALVGCKGKVKEARYELNKDGESYAAVGLEDEESEHLIIRNSYSGKPVTRIAESAFINCSGLQDVTIEEGILRIGEYAFKGCTGLQTVHIGAGVTSIEYSAFRGCVSLTSISLPNLRSIGISVFEDCSSLTRVDFKGTVEEWKMLGKNAQLFTGNTPDSLTVYCSNGRVTKSGDVYYNG